MSVYVCVCVLYACVQRPVFCGYLTLFVPSWRSLSFFFPVLVCLCCAPMPPPSCVSVCLCITLRRTKSSIRYHHRALDLSLLKALVHREDPCAWFFYVYAHAHRHTQRCCIRFKMKALGLVAIPFCLFCIFLIFLSVTVCGGVTSVCLFTSSLSRNCLRARWRSEDAPTSCVLVCA